METLKNRLGSMIAKLKMKQDDKNTLNVETKTQLVPLAKKAIGKQTTVLSGAVGSRSIPISDITGSRGIAPKTVNAQASGSVGGKTQIPISDITGNRGLASLETGFTNNGSKDQGTKRAKDPYIPISVVTGSRDVTTVSPELRAYLQKGSVSATTAMPQEYADLANVLEKAGNVIRFDEWAELTAKQQLAAAQRAGLSLEDQQILLNTRPHYVETIAKVQDVFANRYELGITLADARGAAKELFDIANERNEAITRTGKYEKDAVFAPKALRWLDEEEKGILDNLTKNASEQVEPKWYNGENSEPEEFKETAADIHRRAKYADIDEAEASKQIEAMILKNIMDAKRVAFLSGANKLISEPTVLLSFYLDVKKNAAMDYKSPAVWYKTLPDLPYPKEDKVYDVFGYKVSSSDLGNLNYALVGKALGLPEELLLQQAGAAQLRDHEDVKFFESQRESKARPNYGDELDDQKMIRNGFDVYNALK